MCVRQKATTSTKVAEEVLKDYLKTNLIYSTNLNDHKKLRLSTEQMESPFSV